MTPAPIAPARSIEASPIERVLELVTGKADVRHVQERWLTLRVANSSLYQPIHEVRDALSLRVVLEGTRMGVATTSDLSPEGIRTLVSHAESFARNSPKTVGLPEFPSDSGPAPVDLPCFERKSASIEEAKSQDLSRAIDRIAGQRPKHRVAGVYNEGVIALFVGNTSGLRRSSRRSAAQASLLVEDLSSDPPVSGWAEGASADPDRIQWDSLAQQALDRVPSSQVRSLDPGTYDVVFGAPAIAELTNMLSGWGLGSMSVEEGSSFLRTGQGQELVSPELTIVDDPLHPLGLPESIDYDGTPTRSRAVFDRGVAQGPAHDIFSAARTGSHTTANGLPPEAPYGQYGPIPRHVAFAAGSASPGELVREMRRGVLVTRLHYVRFVHRQRTIVTGMTRDGTYWVENGMIQYPVANLRMTESILGILRRTELTGRELLCCADERAFFAPVVPEILSRSVAFSSATLF